jgi:hypothetical protein
MRFLYSSKQTNNCNLLCIACVFGAPLRIPDVNSLLSKCTLSQLEILEKSSNNSNAIATIILFQLLYWINHGEQNIMSTFKKFNEYNCLDNGSKTLEIIQSLLSRFDTNSTKKGILESVQTKLKSFFWKAETEKEASPSKNIAYFNKEEGRWYINGEPSQETEDTDDAARPKPIENDLCSLPPPPKVEDQQSNSYKFSRYRLQAE